MKKELDVLLKTIRIAGDTILSVQSAGFAVGVKDNKDIVTSADLAADNILKEALQSIFPEDGWLSEETKDDPKRLNCQRVWIVDPIDGTREFATGIPEYAVSVALVANGQPVLAAVFNPATNELFHAVKGQGAWLNDQQIHCSTGVPNKLTLLASRSEYKRGEWDRFAQQHDVKIVGSIAYKLALVAAGKAHATFSLGPKSEWDVAAGVLIVSEAGGIVSNQHKESLIFNQPNILLKGIVAASADADNAVFALINGDSHLEQQTR